MLWNGNIVMSDKRISLLYNREIIWLFHEEDCYPLLAELQCHSQKICKKGIFFRKWFLPATHFML